MNRGRHKKSSKHLVIQILGKTTANEITKNQKEQGNIPNLDVFLHDPSATNFSGGFVWGSTLEGYSYWYKQMEKLKEHPLYKQYRNGRC